MAHGQRPPWWPEGEAWPPQGRWRRPPPFFLWMAAGCLLLFLMFLLGGAALVWLAARAFGIAGAPGEALFATAVAFVLLLIGVSSLGRALQRAAVPVADLVGAFERVADGDYATRVRVRGMRQVRRLIQSFNTMVERLDSAEAQRRRLLADVGHELRTPLSVIQGQLEGAIDGVYERSDAHLGAILEETRHMSRIVEDLRILSLAESGALPLHRRPTSLDEIVDEAVDAHAPPASAAGVSVTSTVPLDLPPVDVDPTRLREVLDNVLTNAIRYTPAGGAVTIGARRYGPSEVRVLVTDTGRGIEPEELPSVFEHFHRSPDSRGSGLGLAIARDLVRAHGGEMDAESEGAGRGTTIRFTLPIAIEG